jgi:hypothetical protein
VNGISRLANQREDAVEAALPKRNFQSGARSETEGTDARYVGQKKVFKPRIVGNVEENIFVPNARLRGAAKLFC